MTLMGSSCNRYIGARVVTSMAGLDSGDGRCLMSTHIYPRRQFRYLNCCMSRRTKYAIANSNC
jgi:hypothetical protein